MFLGKSMKNEKVTIGLTQYWARFTLGILSSVRGLIYLPKPTLALIMGLLTLVFVVPVFNQGDLTHTVFTSHGYLKGHFLDFYDYNKPLTPTGSDYLPILYVIFASWMGVYYIFGESSGPPPSDWPYFLSPGELVWAKILLVVFFSLCVLLLFRIAKLIHPDNPRRQAIATWAFTLSPFAIFAFGIFSQYDVIGVFFTLWAFNKFLQKKLVQFAILIGIAISFKFFAALLFLPLVLLASKKLLEIIKLGLIASLPLVVQLALYWSNESFRNQIFSLAGGKAGGAATSGVLDVVALLYLVVCLSSFFSTRWPGTFEQKAVLFSVAAYGLMFSAVFWHPQWLIILAPFLALMVSMISIPRTWLLWELVAFISFIGFTVNIWIGNVDGSMIERGALAPYVPQAKVLMADFYPNELVTTFQSIMVVFIISP
jgi:hypothetical protein